MYKTTSRKIIAYGKNEFGGTERIPEHLSEGEYRLLLAVLSEARRTCKERTDYITYEARLKRMITLIKTLDFSGV